MRILALDTAASTASVALLTGAEVRLRTLAGPQSSHSGRIMAEISALLAEGGCTLPQLDAIAFGQGPGAFTGVRLACAVAQGLAMGLGIGLVPIESPAALAVAACRQAGTHGASVFVATDARMDEAYVAAYRVALAPNHATAERLGDLHCLPPAQLALPLADHADSGWLAAGSAFRVYADALAPLRTHTAACYPDLEGCADELARLAVLPTQSGQLTAPEHAAPVYVRNKVALTTAERLAAGGKA